VAGEHQPSRVGHTRRWVARLVAAALLAVVVCSHQLWLPLMARALVVDHPPQPADAILVLGGGQGERLERGLELYNEGYAPLLITSGEPPLLPGFETPFAELAADYLAERGIPREDIIVLPDTTSTREEADHSLRLARERGWRTLLVVTAEHHSRRAWLTFRKVYRGSGVNVALVAARGEWYDPRSWWQEERTFLAVWEEYLKLAHYLVKGYLV